MVALLLFYITTFIDFDFTDVHRLRIVYVLSSPQLHIPLDYMKYNYAQRPTMDDKATTTTKKQQHY
eukprot:m.113748 g.113748  ORF g.113748 m.113748 type:complete len:66 (-) comp14146_c0_seq7:125-322(-)